MKRRSFPERRAYSLLRTRSRATPRWRRTWNLSKRMLACGAWWRVEARKAFHMSITANLLAFPGPQPGEERVQARLGAICASEPDRPLPDEIGHHDAIGVPLSEGDLVEPDDPGSRRPSPSQLLAHVLLLQRLDGVPV